MRKWAVPLTVLGVGGVSALLFSEGGRRRLGQALTRFQEAPERWNESAQQELDRIQETLDHLSETLAGEPRAAR